MNQDIERECIEEVKHRHVDGSNGNEFTDNSVNGELLVKDEKEAVVTQESEDELVVLMSVSLRDLVYTYCSTVPHRVPV